MAKTPTTKKDTAQPRKAKAAAKKKPAKNKPYRPEMVERVLDMASAEPVTKMSLGRALGVSARTLDGWAAAHPEFGEVLAIAIDGVGAGAPTKYRRDMCPAVIEWGREGKSLAQIAALLDVSRKTMNRWRETYPEFGEAVERSQDLALAAWHDRGEAGLFMGNGFNDKVWTLIGQNRWPDDFKQASQLNLGLGASGNGSGEIKIVFSADDAALA